MTRNIDPDYAVRYVFRDNGNDKGFAFFNALSDARDYLHLIQPEPGSTDPRYEIIDLKTDLLEVID